MEHIIGFVLGIVSSIVATVVISVVSEKYSYRFGFKRLFKIIIELYWMIQQDGYNPDYIVGIDRNGCIIASILSGYLGYGTILVAGTITVRNLDGSRTITLSPVHIPPIDALSGKKILLVSCFVDTGSALETVYKYFDSLSIRPGDIRAATLFTTPAPRFKPRYFIYETGKNIKVPIYKIMRALPWMTKGWKFVLSDEK
jgi:hypoxanthine phosphoribosyltransferase